MGDRPKAVLSVDIGGTFTDVVVRWGERLATAKVLTTPKAPADGVMTGIAQVLGSAVLAPTDIGLIVHGTTLATNALIERKGARTALVTTAGFRDVIEIACEHRFEQYDIHIDKPLPLVPRRWRFEVAERLDARGRVLVPLDEKGVDQVGYALLAAKIESVAIGFLHSYIDASHERRAAELLRRRLPDAYFSLSSEVCPEIREYNRFSTVCANAYVQPLMARYLSLLRQDLAEAGFRAPVLLMTSGGGLTTLDTAIRYPIRLVESGPAGGAILASTLSRQRGLDRVLSFDMGGTTAKICLIDDGEAQATRDFEVARAYRFAKGSGLPLRIPVIEMVEIGAGGGSIASVDNLGRIQVGPESANSDPGPACYGLGGNAPTVTDADLIVGRIDPDRFAGGRIALSRDHSERAIASAVGNKLLLGVVQSSAGIAEIVEENMASAARVHAVERGKQLDDRTLIAFGGAAPLHAARLAEKLGIRHVVVPASAGVGSAVGFLLAPVAFEVVRSHPIRLDDLVVSELQALLDGMHAEALEVVGSAVPDAPLEIVRHADMRYVGQGHEISVLLPSGRVDPRFVGELRNRFSALYERLYTRSIPSLEIEILSWSVRLAERRAAPPRCQAPKVNGASPPLAGSRAVFDPDLESMIAAKIVRRDTFAEGTSIVGPALIVEDETTTYVTPNFVAAINVLGHIEMWARDKSGGRA
ncbi:MAG: hydantoinase/oxoprolinase family protein [Alphaproteobacteria bacterium]|nr:hydantoinase/oxoprolinase family protein [Alphaproteobacteria bacterium]